MSSPHSTRLAWSVAIASLALWATSVPTTAGQVAAGATRLFDETLTPTADGTEVITTLTPASPCAPDSPTPAVVGQSDGTTMFHLCGADPQAEQGIAQLIGGHAFNASIAAHGDGCAELSIRVLPQLVSGRASSHLAVSVGAQRRMQLDITSEAGVTHVSIGADQ